MEVNIRPVYLVGITIRQETNSKQKKTKQCDKYVDPGGGGGNIHDRRWWGNFLNLVNESRSVKPSKQAFTKFKMEILVLNVF